MKGGKGGGRGHSMSGSRGNSKIGINVKYPMADGPGTSGGKSPKSSTEYDCGCTTKRGQPNSN